MRSYTAERLGNTVALALMILLGATGDVRAQLCPDEPPLVNHDGSGFNPCLCFVPAEQAGAVFTLPASAYPIEILKIRIGWASQFGGQPAALEQAIHVYQGGLPNPGSPIFTLAGPTLVDGMLNEFDIEPLPGQVIVNSDPFTVTLEFLNQSSGNAFATSVVDDGNGCQTGRNVVFVQPGGWNDACPLGVLGDWVFEVVYRPVNCARCPEQPALANYSGTSWTALPTFVPGEQAGSVFTIPAADLPAEIVKVRVGWDTNFGGSNSSIEQAIHVYQGGLPNPGTPIFTLPGPTLVEGGLNEFDLEPLPGAVVVNSSPATVMLQFFNQSSGNPFAPAVLYDGDGCQLGKNAVLDQTGMWADGCMVGVPGDFVFEAVYKPMTCSGAGRIPDGNLVPGVPLKLTRLAGGDLQLDWSPSCDTGDTGYVVYEGTLGSYYSHGCKPFTSIGATSATLTPSSGSTYYIVVPTDGTIEGSHGVDSRNVQRPQGSGTACLTRQIGSCP